MAAQAAIAAMTAVSAINITGTALSISPRGKNSDGVLLWVSPGATSLDDIRVDMTYRTPTAQRKTAKSLTRVFSPKTLTDSTTGAVSKVGDNIISMDVTLLENATAADKQKVLDIFTSVITSDEFRDTWINGNSPY